MKELNGAGQGGFQEMITKVAFRALQKALLQPLLEVLLQLCYDFVAARKYWFSNPRICSFLSGVSSSYPMR